MRRVTTAVVLALALSSARTAAQQRPASGRVTVTGVVVDSLTGRPVAAATVSFRSARRVVFTDTLGRFSLEAVSVPAEQVQARQLGYATTTFDTPVRPENPPLLIYLAPDPIPLRAITARAKDDGRYTFEGTVIDSATGRPLPRAVVWFRTSRGTGISDTLGHYLFENARAGFEDIVGRCAGLPPASRLPRRVRALAAPGFRAGAGPDRAPGYGGADAASAA